MAEAESRVGFERGAVLEMGKFIKGAYAHAREGPQGGARPSVAAMIHSV